MTIEDLPWPALSAATAGWALAFWSGVYIIRGKLVPRSTLDDVINDRNEWRNESRVLHAEIAEKDTQLRHVAEVGETQKVVLSTLQRLAPRGDTQ